MRLLGVPPAHGDGCGRFVCERFNHQHAGQPVLTDDAFPTCAAPGADRPDVLDPEWPARAAGRPGPGPAPRGVGGGECLAGSPGSTGGSGAGRGRRPLGSPAAAGSAACRRAGDDADGGRLPAANRGPTDRTGNRDHGLVDGPRQPGGSHVAGCHTSSDRAGRGSAAQGQGHADPYRSRPRRRRPPPRTRRHGARAATARQRVRGGCAMARGARDGGRGIRRGPRREGGADPDRPRLAQSRRFTGQRGGRARNGSRPTLDALESMSGGARAVDPALLARLARATVFGVARPA